MVRVGVKGVRVQRAEAASEPKYLSPKDRTFVMLRETEGRRVLDIEIGQAEAFAIGSALEGSGHGP